MVMGNLYGNIRRPKLEGKTFYYHEVFGFEIWDENFGKVGLIKGVNDQSAQPLFEIDSSGQEILIPIHDEFIKSADREKKIIKVSTPAGLIELFLDWCPWKRLSLSNLVLYKTAALWR